LVAEWCASSEQNIKRFIRESKYPGIRTRTFKGWVAKAENPATEEIETLRRRKYSVHFKLQALQRWDNEKTEMTLHKFCSKNNFSNKVFEKWLPSTVRDGLKKRAMPRFRVKQTVPGKYPDAEEKLALKGDKITGHWVQGTMKRIMNELHPDVVFHASDRWLLGGRSGRRFVKGWMHRFGYSFRKPTKRKVVPIEELLPKVGRFHFWAVEQMARQSMGSVEGILCTGNIPELRDFIWTQSRWILAGSLPGQSARKEQKLFNSARHEKKLKRDSQRSCMSPGLKESSLPPY